MTIDGFVDSPAVADAAALNLAAREEIAGLTNNVQRWFSEELVYIDNKLRVLVEQQQAADSKATQNTIHGGIFIGPVFQGQDFEAITFGAAGSQMFPPPEPDDPPEQSK